MQTQTSNTLHNAIMEAGSKDRPPMLAPGNYVQWKSIIKRYIDTKPNHELIYYCLENPPNELGWKDKEIPTSKGSLIITSERVHETYKNVSQEIRDQLNAKAEVVQIILTGIDNDIYSTIDACSNACEMWKAIESLKHGESINVQDLETNLYWEFRKFTSQDGESLELYYSRFYKIMNKLIRNQCKVTNHQVNVQFLLQLQPEWQRFMTLVKKSQELKSVSYYKLYDILKQHQHEVNKIRAEKIARVANPLALVAQQQPDKEIDKLMALISLSFKKIYKPTNNNLRTSSNTSHANQDNSLRINSSAGYENQRIGNVAGARETVDQELEAHYMYMAQLQEVSPDAADSGPIFDDEPVQKLSNDDHYNVFAIEKEIDQNDNDNDLAKEHELLASLIEKLKCEIDESKNHNKFLETSNKVLIEKLKGEIEYFKNKNKSLESSNNFFKEANSRLSETNNLLYADYKKSEAELARHISKEYASQVELKCAKVRGELLSYKMEYQKSCTKYTETINDLNQTISKMKDKLSAHQETISILSKQKEAQIKLYKTREDKKLEKAIELENKVKVLDNIVYKTGQTVQTMNMLNNKCRTIFAKPEFLKKDQRANPRLINAGLDQFHRCLNEEMVADLRYFNSLELEDLKAQLQDKGIVISELKKLIEKLKGKSVDTKKDFLKSTSVTRTNVSNDFSKPVIAQTLPPNKKPILKSTNVLAPRMYKIHTDHTQTRTSQLSQDSRKFNKRVSFSTGVIPTTSVSRPQLKSNPMRDRVMRNNNQGKKQEVDVKVIISITYMIIGNPRKKIG
nr:hypothetical protein [Tanacetum cinerariifolium]